jgi:hypothetical protein
MKVLATDLSSSMVASELEGRLALGERSVHGVARSHTKANTKRF